MTRVLRTVQCAKCPWKVDTDPFDIPNGYSPDLHAGLRGTIAHHGFKIGGGLRLMACHESAVGEETPCIGWLINQLGPGNNLALRIWAMRVENIGEARIVGEQHPCFEDTLPDSER